MISDAEKRHSFYTSASNLKDALESSYCSMKTLHAVYIFKLEKINLHYSFPQNFLRVHQKEYV